MKTEAKLLEELKLKISKIDYLKTLKVLTTDQGTYTLKDGERIDLSGNVDELRKTDIPCWSVGRLIEIYIIARGLDTAYLPIERGEDMVKYLIQLYKEKMKDLNFSNLKE